MDILTVKDEPRHRSAVLAEILLVVSPVEGGTKLSSIVEQVGASMGKSEEECAPEIYAALSMLVRLGALNSNTYDQETQTMTFKHDTAFTPGKALTGYIWRPDVLNGPA
jgi:hypothetical protein